MNFDEILALIGGFGKFQKILYIWICLPQIFLAFHMLVSIFTGAVPPHLCRSTRPSAAAPPPSSDFNFSLLSGPGGQPELSCTALDSQQNLTSDLANGSCRGGWEYSKETFHSTVVTEVSVTIVKPTVGPYVSVPKGDELPRVQIFT